MKKNQSSCLAFLQTDVYWPENNLYKVFFTDESKFSVSGCNGNRSIRIRTEK